MNDYLVSTIDGEIHVAQWDEEAADYTGESIVIDAEEDTATLKQIESGYIWNESIKVLKAQVSSMDFDEALNLVS